MTFTGSCRSRKARATCSPSIAGMSMSSKAMSGRSVSMRSSAARPSPASATTSRSASASIVSLSPWRTIGWSSAMTMRISALVSAMGELHLQRDRRAGAGDRLDHRPPVEEPRALDDTHQPGTVVRGSCARLRVEASTIVADRDGQESVTAPHRDLSLGRLRVLHHIVDGLLDDAKEQDLRLL